MSLAVRGTDCRSRWPDRGRGSRRTCTITPPTHTSFSRDGASHRCPAAIRDPPAGSPDALPLAVEAGGAGRAGDGKTLSKDRCAPWTSSLSLPWPFGPLQGGGRAACRPPADSPGELSLHEAGSCAPRGHPSLGHLCHPKEALLVRLPLRGQGSRWRLRQRPDPPARWVMPPRMALAHTRRGTLDRGLDRGPSLPPG